MSAARSTRTSAKKKRGIPTGIPSARCLCFVPCRRRQHGTSARRIARGIQGLQPPRKRHAGVSNRIRRKRGIPLRGVKTGKQSLILPPLLRFVPPSAARDFVWEDCPRHPRASASRESDTPALRIGREENGESQPEFPLRGRPGGLRAASKGFALVDANKIGRKRPFRTRKGNPNRDSLCPLPLLRPVLPSAARDFVWEDCPRYPRASAPAKATRRRCG